MANGTKDEKSPTLNAFRPAKEFGKKDGVVPQLDCVDFGAGPKQGAHSKASKETLKVGGAFEVAQCV